jgi:6-phosphogluconate dehydrogenase (decarboxylating)
MQIGMTGLGRVGANMARRLALAMRGASQGKGDCGAKQPAQLRNRFCGHAVQPGGARGSRVAGKNEKP